MSNPTAHLSLYRRWRPQRFADIVGQDEIVRTVRNAVVAEEVAHAYLFAGERGIGKTSIARILARAVNCLDPIDGEPCNLCANCTTILGNRSLDIVEIDGASNRGIDHIRRLREEVSFTPTDLKMKVYIIDEVHMLTNEAFNALLKTLEEPPPHVVFAFATTEPHKVPRTVISRCQAFLLRRIPLAEIARQLARVAVAEGTHLSDGAVNLIARRASGGMRDALVMLEQATSYEGKEVTEAALLEMLGLAGSETREAFLTAIWANDRTAALQTIDSLAERGKDLEVFLADVIQLLRDRMLSDTAIDDRSIAIARRLLEIKADLFRALDRRIRLEVGLLDLMRSLTPADERGPPVEKTPSPAARAVPASDLSSAVPSARPDRATDVDLPDGSPTEDRRRGSDPVSEETDAGDPPSQVTEPGFPGPFERVPLTTGFQGDWAKMLSVVERERIAIAAFLAEAQAMRIGDKLIISFHPEHTFHKESLEKHDNLQYLAGAVRRHFGDEVRAEVRFDNDVVPKPLPRDLLRQKAELICEMFDGRIVKEES